MRRRCCCKGCAASFTIAKIGTTNSYTFTDTSVGTHTRVWTTQTGGTSTTSPWVHTFPDAGVYWVKLVITYSDGRTCEVTQFVGAHVPCPNCIPTDLAQSAYITIPSVTAGPQNVCIPIRNQVPGTWEIRDPLNHGCAWSAFYPLGTCLTCPNIGASYVHTLFLQAEIRPKGFPVVAEVEIYASLGLGPSRVSSDCNPPTYTGGSAEYLTSLGAPPTSCTGVHTLPRFSQGGGLERYVEWPLAITINIPGF